MTRATCTTRRSVMGRGFSLIEILIAIMVLGLGLLGLGAIFPVVIAQQQNAVTTTRATIVIETIEGMLKNGEVIDFGPVHDTIRFSARRYKGEPWFTWDIHVDASSGGGVAGAAPYDPARSNAAINYQAARSGASKGAILIAGETLPVSARLYPQPFGDQDPEFVWDFVARRAPASKMNPDVYGRAIDGKVNAQYSTVIEVAVFLRRIDPRIKAPDGKTLSDVFTGSGGLLPIQIRTPVTVGADPENAGKLGMPTGDGAGRYYAAPIVTEVEVKRYADDRELGADKMRIIEGGSANIPKSTMTQRLLAAKVGQKLVDNTGVVRTVLERIDTGDPDEVIVKVTPAFTSGEFRADGTDMMKEIAPRAANVWQIAFVQHVPEAVSVFRVTE